MWHEARKQEKKIRGMMVDYKRRAERRREYYEKIKQDPAQFLQVHGCAAKIHLDPAVAIAADSPATMMPWQGQAENLIDRFDVRAHLDIIPDYKLPTEPPKITGEELVEDRKICYERYRTLVQNDFLGVNEDKFLYQIFLEERYGPVLKPGFEDEKKKSSDKKAAIGYVYEDSTSFESPLDFSLTKDEQIDEDEENEDEKEEDLSDIDLDVTVDVSVLNPAQCAEMNAQSIKYGMVDDDFITYLMNDKDEAEQLKLAREIEEEKAMYSGRKSRRERRALREKKLAGRKITSPPSYAARDSPTYAPMRHSTSKSRSRSPPNAGKIMFITSFGGEVSDGEPDLKTSSDKNASSSSKSKDNASTVIGPQLPAKNGDDQAKVKSKSHKARKHSSSSSKSSSSSREHRHRKSSSDRYHRKHYKHRKTRVSRSPSSSSSSPSKRARSKNTSSRRSSSPSSRRSRSVSHSRSKSRSHTQSHHTKTRSRSRSKSTSKMNVDRSSSPLLPPPPVKSYYRHSLSRSNSELSEDSGDENKSTRSSHNSNMSSTSKSLPFLGKAGPATKSRITPQERLKRKMQIALKKQYKADKKAQMEKTEKQLQERQDREEELREMAIKLRQRERERRHRMRGYGADSDSDSAWAHTPEHGSHNLESHISRKGNQSCSRSSSSSSYSSSAGRSPKATTSLNRYRSRSRTKSPPVKTSRRSPLLERRHSPPHRFTKRSSPRHSPRRSPPRHSPRRNAPRHSPRRTPPRYSPRRSSPRHSPRRSPPRHSPRRSPSHSYRRSPARSSYNVRDIRHNSPRRYSPQQSPPRRYGSNSRYSRQENYSPTRSRPPMSKSRPLVDY